MGLQRLAEEVAEKRLPGHVVECGVYRGGSAVVIAERLLRGRSSSRKMWLFDVFTGMPEPGPEDPAEAWDAVGNWVSNEDIVRANLRAAKVPLERIHVVVGRYQDTFPDFKPPSIAFIHIDCDWYESVRLCLETFYDAVVPGGVLVFDDYGFWSGCRKAVDEFLSQRAPLTKLTPIDDESYYFLKA